MIPRAVKARRGNRKRLARDQRARGGGVALLAMAATMTAWRPYVGAGIGWARNSSDVIRGNVSTGAADAVIRRVSRASACVALERKT